MKRKILAIDDSITLREFISRAVTRYSLDYEVLLAKHATMGLAMAAAELPDLILLDYVLPDMKGDEVCRRLLAQEATRDIPVLLMSSSAAEIKRTQAQYKNVVISIAKPFTPELLCAGISFVFREGEPNPEESVAGGQAPQPPSSESTGSPADPALPAPSSSGSILLCGDTRHSSLLSALLAVEQDRWRGVFRIFMQEAPVELYVSDGRPLLVTTRDDQAYLKNCTFSFNPEQLAEVANALKTQQQNGCPVFMSLFAQQLMHYPEAVGMCQEQGWRVFAPAWTTHRVRFEFEPSSILPDYATRLQPFEGAMSEWAMESLRRVGDDFLSALAWGEPTGIPAYTRRGYELIQQIPLNDQELRFAELTSSTLSLAQIAEQMGLSVEDAQRILHRFLCMEIFDYWPASLLRAA